MVSATTAALNYWLWWFRKKTVVFDDVSCRSCKRGLNARTRLLDMARGKEGTPRATYVTVRPSQDPELPALLEQPRHRDFEVSRHWPSSIAITQEGKQPRSLFHFSFREREEKRGGGARSERENQRARHFVSSIFLGQILWQIRASRARKRSATGL